MVCLATGTFVSGGFLATRSRRTPSCGSIEGHPLPSAWSRCRQVRHAMRPPSRRSVPPLKGREPEWWHASCVGVHEGRPARMVLGWNACAGMSLSGTAFAQVGALHYGFASRCDPFGKKAV